jgi:hypothetical protein
MKQFNTMVVRIFELRSAAESVSVANTVLDSLPHHPGQQHTYPLSQPAAQHAAVLCEEGASTAAKAV